MLDHHIQKSIVQKLAFADSLRFSELKPEDLENKLFDYHLKKVLAAGYATKSEDGSYKLTSEGRRLGVKTFDKMQEFTKKAYSVLFLAIKRKDGAWLLYRRKRHPLKDKFGFMHAVPISSEPILDTATRTCREQTGLEADFKVSGSGFFKTFDGDELESFTNFTLLYSEDFSGELKPASSDFEFFWQTEIDDSDPDLLPNMPTLLELLDQKKLFFIDKTIKL